MRRRGLRLDPERQLHLPGEHQPVHPHLRPLGGLHGRGRQHVHQHPLVARQLRRRRQRLPGVLQRRRPGLVPQRHLPPQCVSPPRSSPVPLDLEADPHLFSSPRAQTARSAPLSVARSTAAPSTATAHKREALLARCIWAPRRRSLLPLPLSSPTLDSPPRLLLSSSGSVGGSRERDQMLGLEPRADGPAHPLTCSSSAPPAVPAVLPTLLRPYGTMYLLSPSYYLGRA